MIWLRTRWMERQIFGFTMADVMRLAYLLAVRNGIKNHFFKRNEKTGRKWLINFVRHHQEISVTTPEVHSQERGASFLNQQLSIFKSKTPLCTPFNIILQDYTIAMKPAQTHENIRIERQRLYILFNLQSGSLLWQSSTVWVLMDISFLRYFYCQENIWNQNGWMAHRLDQSARAIPRSGYTARFSPSGFLISSNIQRRQNKILLS